MQRNHSRHSHHRICRRFTRHASIALLVLLSGRPVAGQLAITEVMSNAISTNLPNGGDDFWELTNFGTNTIDLATCWFRDRGDFGSARNLAGLWMETPRFDPPVILPGESILFVRQRVHISTPEHFRIWWGDARLAPDLKIVFYPAFGFSNTGDDEVNLWQVTPDQTNLVQEVRLFESRDGTTFTFDPLTGVLDTFSAAGVDGAFIAATTADVGSPGVTLGPVPLRVLTTPASTEVDGGAPVTLVVQAQGLPAPRYQWRFNGSPIPGARAPILALPAATSSDAGQYSVEVDNGLERLVTPPATLTVNTQSSCVRIVRPLADIDVTPNQTAIFAVDVRGYPLPTFRWQFNGADIPGATNRTYSVAGADHSHIGLYTVHVTNPLCTTNAGARLDVVPVPNLVATEAMASPADRLAWGHGTWWELTNAGTNAVKLLGYRWDDLPFSLTGAVTNTNHIVLQPGQSAIFVSSMTPEAFRRWWGEENLPAGLPIISHPGIGLSQSGDAIQLWNATATNPDDYIFNVGVLDFNIPPTMGVSLLFDSVFGDLSLPSVEGEGGAFRAAEGGDIGSPGWTSNAQRVVRPRVTSIHHGASGVTITWKTQPGRTYELRYCNNLGGSDWFFLVRLRAEGDSLTAMDDTIGSGSQRFYQVLLIP